MVVITTYTTTTMSIEQKQSQSYGNAKEIYDKWKKEEELIRTQTEKAIARLTANIKETLSVIEKKRRQALKKLRESPENKDPQDEYTSQQILDMTQDERHELEKRRQVWHERFWLNSCYHGISLRLHREAVENPEPDSDDSDSD